ncbi:MAG TPA: hypothetical protein VMH40_06565 [Myxococcaceae bacterium]|nr:hypothetical protein [Myxococcaceae bacterium]
MTAESTSERPAAGAGWLLRLGTRVAISSLVPLLALAGVLGISRAAQGALWPALFTAEPELQLEETLLVAGAGLVLAAALARAAVLALAVQAGAARFVSGATPGVSPPVAGVRGLAWAVAAAVLEVVLGAWYWAVLVASGAALVLGGPVVSFLGAAGVAGVLTLGAFLFPATALWLELGLVTSVVRPVRFPVAAGEALRLLLARPGFVVLAWLVTALPAGMLVGGIQVMAAGTPGPGAAAAAAGGVALLLVALVEALATLVRLDAFAALVLDAEGGLPAPPPPPPAPPPPVPRATLVGSEVVEASPVGPVAPWSPGGQG